MDSCELHLSSHEVTWWTSFMEVFLLLFGRGEGHSPNRVATPSPDPTKPPKHLLNPLLISPPNSVYLRNIQQSGGTAPGFAQHAFACCMATCYLRDIAVRRFIPILSALDDIAHPVNHLPNCDFLDRQFSRRPACNHGRCYRSTPHRKIPYPHLHLSVHILTS